MKKFWIILPLFLLVFGFSFAQQEATTHDVRKVLQYPYGTWKPAKVESTAGIHPANIAHPELHTIKFLRYKGDIIPSDGNAPASNDISRAYAEGFSDAANYVKNTVTKKMQREQ